jgi:hypothetical protein
MLRRIFLSLLVVLLAAGTLQAADASFLGKWKLNSDKSTLHDEMKVTSAGPNRSAFDFSGGTPEFIVVDGTDQPGLDGSTLAVTSEGPNNWRVVRKKDGRLEISAIWTLSPDGNTLHDNFTGYQPNGSTFHLHYLYARTAGSSGFSGTWDSTSEKLDSAVEIEVAPYQGDGLSFTNRARQSTKIMKFDGKDYPVQDANAPKGAMSSARRINATTLEFTEKTSGKVKDTQHIQLSPDGNTLTMTIQPANGRKPNIFVFDRE